MKKTRQINNLKIVPGKQGEQEGFYIVTPDNRKLEFFITESRAREFCTETKDFVKKK